MVQSRDASLPEIGVANPYEVLQISSVTCDQLNHLYRKRLQRLSQLSEQHHNGEINEIELMQLVQQTHHEMEEEIEKLLGKEDMRQFGEMMATYSRHFLELYGISVDPW
jgi:ERCC4-related helicase